MVNGMKDITAGGQPAHFLNTIHTVIHDSPELPNSAVQQPRQTQQKGAYQQAENLSKFFCVLGTMVYLHVSSAQL
jgi:hypothetical protein